MEINCGCYLCGVGLQKERYDSMPKVHLIIGLSSLLLVVLTVIWVLVYRRIARRRRRRTLGVFKTIIIHINYVNRLFLIIIFFFLLFNYLTVCNQLNFELQKLVTDLQSGDNSLLLNSDSDED